ncbi:GIY-YIG nuclease family protein [Corynebacterium epidermidicanis]|uniref:Bacteriophage T5 Orf172 DNA-binding domain-containing protein n=1 Tax=Corynebacterium epidermidicanis TaxID=1050174 RepID=A0A0G3GQ69_9CORY|nr:GIY-YIG nuclease family protein [Corynebacterium epidermidicanis]AKK02700.1 hypothetical protein CEPID_04135 [Corynebacterium epidermidicanis]
MSLYDDFDKLLESDLDGLLDEPEKVAPVTSQDRLERAFLEINEFYRENREKPSSTTRNISERKLGARLDGILANPNKIEALKHLDEFALLELPEAPTTIDELNSLDDLDLLGDDSGIFDVGALPAKPRKNEDAAKRKPAKDFDKFKPLFIDVQQKLEAGDLILVPFGGVSTIEQGKFFVLGGLTCYIAEVKETKLKANGDRLRPKQRLRVIFSNGTESSMYRQSLAIRMYEQQGRAFAQTSFDETEIMDPAVMTGHIYVLKSQSTDPQIAGMKDLYKIGYSRTAVEKRIANAATDPTYLMSPVEIVADYELQAIRPSALENLIHRVFDSARLQLSQIDLEGKNYTPKEWFVVPLTVINQAIDMIRTGDIVEVHYDRELQKLVLNEEQELFQ